jgi:hypothetical protein
MCVYFDAWTPAFYFVSARSRFAFMAAFDVSSHLRIRQWRDGAFVNQPGRFPRRREAVAAACINDRTGQRASTTEPAF